MTTAGGGTRPTDLALPPRGTATATARRTRRGKDTPVPGTNLTRTEARERAGLVEVSSYDVDLDLTTGEETFASTTTVRFTCSDPGASTFVDLIAPRVRLSS